MQRRHGLAACLILVSCAQPPREGSLRANTVEIPSSPEVLSVSSSAAPASVPAVDPDWAQELAWARARFPELRSFIVEVEFRPLLAWVPVGKAVTLYFRAEFKRSDGTEARYDCVPVEATREIPDGGAEDGIGLLIPGPERIGQGQTTRDYVTAGVLAWGVAFGGGFGKQRKRRDGTWESFDSYGTGYTQLGAYVGPVEGDAAYFRYGPVDLGASCGPFVKRVCDDGSAAECNACTTVDLTLHPYEGRTPMPRSQCDAPCPVIVNPDLERLQQLIKRFPKGFVQLPGRPDVALYRTRSACKTDPSWKEPKTRP